MLYTIRHGGEEIVEQIDLMQLIYIIRWTEGELKALVNLALGQSLYLSDLRVHVMRIPDKPYEELFTSPLLFHDRDPKGRFKKP